MTDIQRMDSEIRQARELLADPAHKDTAGAYLWLQDARAEKWLIEAQKSLAIDLFCGLGGWAEGFLAEGYDVIGFDIERRPYPGQLVLQDVLTLCGSQFKDAAAIVASPPCQAYSYRAMPWKRAKALPPPDNALFEACFRIQREASAAAGRDIPMVIENVKGAQPWVGPARWHYGSFYLWGDVPAIMPYTLSRVGDGIKQHGSGADWFDTGIAALPSGSRGTKNGGDWFGPGGDCSLQRRASSRSPRRAAASAEIAKIPFPLAQHIAAAFKQERLEAEERP